MATKSRDEIYDAIRGFIEESFLGESGISELDSDTPLLEWGVLNSMNTSVLLNYIRTELDVTVPPTYITGRHFHTVETITDMVHELTAQPR